MSYGVHPTAVIDTSVTLGTGVTVGAFVRIEGDVEVGDHCWIATGCVIGAPPEIREWSRDSRGAGVSIGMGSVIREYAQVHSGSEKRTHIGPDCLIQNQSYIAHDVDVGEGVVLAPSVLLAGHVIVGRHANVGMGARVHQFRSIGRGAMVGMGSVVVADVPDWSKVMGVPARVRGANVVGLQRSGADMSVIEPLDRAFRDGRLEVASALLSPTGL